MRLIKAILAGATGLFVIITLFSLLIPAKVHVSRVVLINTTATEVYRQIANFENWKKWHPVFTTDSAKLYWDTQRIAGKDPGYRIVHHGKEIIITLLSADSASVRFLLQARGENDIDNDVVITKPPASPNFVQVEWRATTKLHWYPWEKWYGIFIDKLTGPGYEAALNGLKKDIEKRPLSPAGEPERIKY
ncbi:MAG: SRPBCC family protein [Ferruginibacter sp.]